MTKQLTHNATARTCTEIRIYRTALEQTHSHSLQCVVLHVLPLSNCSFLYLCMISDATMHSICSKKEKKKKIPVRNSNNLSNFKQTETEYLTFEELIKTYVVNNGSCNIKSKTHLNIL